MNKILEETLANEKPDPTFEQRMLSGFRSRIPQRSGLVKLLVDLMRVRAVQITAVATVLLGLVQIGRMITGEGVAVPRDYEYRGGEEYVCRRSRHHKRRQTSSALCVNRKAGAIKELQPKDRDRPSTCGRAKCSRARRSSSRST